MAEDGKAAQEVAETPETQVESGLTTEAMQKELERARKDAAKYRQKVKEIEDSKAQAEIEAAKKRGEFEQLYLSEVEKNKKYEEDLTKIRSNWEAEYEAITAAWDDNDRALVPQSLDVYDKLQLAKRLQNKFASAQTPGVATVGKGGKYGGYNSVEEFSEKDPRAYLKSKGLLK